MDILIRNKRTQEVIAVEVKTGAATRGSRQMAKDTRLATGEGTEFTGKQAGQAGYETGEGTGAIRTVEARPKVKKPNEP
jgi:hypothetical protein